MANLIDECVCTFPGVPSGYVDLRKKAEFEKIPFEVLEEAYKKHEFRGQTYRLLGDKKIPTTYAVSRESFSKWLYDYRSTNKD